MGKIISQLVKLRIEFTATWIPNSCVSLIRLLLQNVEASNHLPARTLGFRLPDNYARLVAAMLH
jgi:hypothetical protein